MKDASFAKLVVFINGLIPLAIMAWDAANGGLGPNPSEYIERTTGSLALIFLILALAVTPLRRFTGSNFFSHFRRMLGLFGFFYAVIHLLSYLNFDQEWKVSSIIADVVKRRFIFVGMISLLLLAPLAATSTAASIRRLGAKRWKALHRLAYLATALGVLHYYLLVKADVRKPMAFAIVLAFLLAIRLFPASTPRAPVFARR